MKRWFFEFAGLRLCVQGPVDYMPRQMMGLEPFEAPAGDYDHILDFSVVEELDPPEGEELFHQPDKCVFRQGDTQIRYDGMVGQSLCFRPIFTLWEAVWGCPSAAILS